MEEFGSSPITNPNPMEASHDCAGQHCFCSCSCSSSNPVRSFTGRKRPFYPEEEGVGEEEGQGQGQEEEEEEEEYDDHSSLHQRSNCKEKGQSLHGGCDGIPEQSFRESFYSSGTDWSTLYCVDDYGIPIENPEKVSINEEETVHKCKNTLLITERKEVLQGKLVQSTLSSCWGSKVDKKTRSVIVDEVKRDERLDFWKRFDPIPCTIAKKSNVKASYISKPSSTSSTRICPFYKKIPGTTFVVDAFRYGAVAGCSAYFLTHFHADHYGGLTKSWEHGPIYCTPITAKLLTLCLRVNERWIHPISLRTTQIIDGVQVRMLDANHCPGAAIILFQLRNGQFVLHTGDFRACKEMQNYPELSGSSIHTLYLDTTYCNQKYRFPLQNAVIEFVVQVAQAALKKNKKTLIVVGAYSIGKERVYLGIAEALNVKIFVERRRSQILNALEWPELLSKLSTESSSTLLHVLPIGYLQPQKLKAYLQNHPKFNSILAFRPTGWTFSEKIGDQLHLLKPTISGCVTIYGVPYSEHSSFVELQEFVQFLKPQKIIPTVNVGRAQMRDQMESYFRQWLQKGTPNCRL